MSRHDPFTGLSESQLKFNLGGEVDMWGEGVDETNFEPRVFPWTSAVAERLWSPANVTDVDAAQERLAEHVCRLNMRGVAAEAVMQNFCLSDVL